MKVSNQFAEALVGKEVNLSFVDMVVLQNLIDVIKKDLDTSMHKSLYLRVEKDKLQKIINFIDKISDDVTSFADAEVELFGSNEDSRDDNDDGMMEQS